MTIVNHECYVSLEVAKLLKQAGFDWKCGKIYYEDDGKWELEDNYKKLQRLLELDYCLLAPTLDVAQRWLREVGNKNGTVILTLNFNENVSKHWEVKGIHLNKDRTVMHWFYTCHVKICGRGIIPVDCWDTYEEAQEAGIKKALEIVLEKGE